MGATDIAMGGQVLLDGLVFVVQGLSVEAVFQDRGDAAIGGCADGKGLLAGDLQAWSAIAVSLI